MNFSKAIQTCMGKYATFTGRGSRSEFWWFYLFTVLVAWAASIVGAVTGGEQMASVMSLLVNLALMIPGIAASARRLHDTDRSGWWLLISLTIIGIIVLIVFWAQESQQGTNRFGEQPVE